MPDPTPDERAFQNTDRELWREREGDYYADSIHVTEQGGVGINVGGTVYVKRLAEWHALAGGPSSLRDAPERAEALRLAELYVMQVNVNGVVYVRQDSREDYWRANRAEAERAELAREVEELRGALRRSVSLAQHLWQMIPQGVWRDHGGDDMQGHYEGDYHAEQVREELAHLAALSEPTEREESAHD